jgi:hypothetical protein
VRTGYHQTAPEICNLIMQSNFKPGTSGWCGGAVYFATTPEATVTKAIAANSHDGCMIEAKVRMGRVKRVTCGKPCHCEGFNSWKTRSEGYTSVTFNPGDGEELVIYNPDQIISKRVLPYQDRWRVRSLRRRRGAPLNMR